MVENLHADRRKIQEELNRNTLYEPQFEHDNCGFGFVANLKGKRSHQIVKDGLHILHRLDHRGACGCETNTGDGAGIMVQPPHTFFKRVCGELGIELPELGDYAAGNVFLPTKESERNACIELLEKYIKEEGQELLGWRDVPTDNSDLGKTALDAQPAIRQVFIKRGEGTEGGMPFERKLFVIRKRTAHAIRSSGLDQSKMYYICSLSYRKMVYKGMLTSGQLLHFYDDLREEDFDSALAMIHSRFSTNTFPSWDLAQPFRYISHNGEINTVRGNFNWMRARESLFKHAGFTEEEMNNVLPVLIETGSDSAILDNAIELLELGGRSLPHVMCMLIPEAWSKHQTMDQKRKDFYNFHACLMEPWDGPASIAFTDGSMIGGVLDRNGLRPSRYWITKDDTVIMASEVGVLEVPSDRVHTKGRLQPGRIFLVDTVKGKIVADEELKAELANAQPYGEWLKENLVKLEDLPEAPHVPEPDHETVFHRQKAFGYTKEDLKIIMGPMANHGQEGIGSMGNDAPLAVLSNFAQPLYSYFKQLFAQVTNPPLDAIREELVTDVGTTLGPEKNLLDPDGKSCRHIAIKSPILDNDELAKLTHLKLDGFKTKTIQIVFPIPANGHDGAGEALEKAMGNLLEEAEKAVKDGNNMIILSDRGLDESNAAIPALLATSGVHHHLVRLGLRTQAALILESGEPREIQHFAVLLGYGVNAVNPYLAFETLDDMLHCGQLKEDLDHETAVKNYIKAANKGVVKVMSKMGISTIQSYRGAQIFEAIGISSKVIDKYFTKTVSRIEGIGLEEIAKEQIEYHDRAYPDRPLAENDLKSGGQYAWRRDGEFHLFNPQTVHMLQYAVRTGDYGKFKKYSSMINNQAKNLCTLRGLFKFKKGKPIPIEEVEPASEIVKRFATGAMSYGSISQEAHENLAIAMNRLGAWSNTGEGGEDVDRFTPLPNGDSKCSAIKQVASGRFGVTSRYLTTAREIQIKIAQGAKPGEGGQLPGTKVYPWIAKTRHSTPFVGLISPPPHHDIYSIEDLAQLIFDLKNSNPKARIGVKLVSEIGVGTIAAGVSKAHADVILVSGHDGGTGASPLNSIKHAGAPWELGVAETQQTLVANGLRGRVVLQTDGQLKTGRDAVIACLLGAEEFGFATTALVASGCIMMRKCQLDTCPVGVATQNPELRKKFTGTPEHVVNFMMYIAEEMREIMAELGFRTINEMVGQVQLIEVNEAIKHWKSKGLDFSKILAKATPRYENVAIFNCEEQDHGIDTWLDNDLIRKCRPAIQDKEKVELEIDIQNLNRATGTMLGSAVTKMHPEGLPDKTIHIKFNGSAGQSFGAFTPKGLELELEGDSNDYFGKGLSGGRLILYPPKDSPFVAEEQIIVGNVCAYGATDGEMFIRGIGGERFCVRNSGVHAVIEGIGDHGCEYMTGGRVVVLGSTGRNFAAGMSGGIAFVLDEEGDFDIRCNHEMVELEKLDQSEDLVLVKGLIERHLQYTDSAIAKRVLDNWEALLPKFIKVMPSDYKQALEKMKEEEENELQPSVAD